jgi:hypothetical protein
MSAPVDGDDRRPLAYYEAVPYLLVLESVERGGEWLRRAEHPELPGCVAEAPSALEALDKLEQERLRVLRHCGTAEPRSQFRGHPSATPDPGKEARTCWHATTTSE